jgi:hypothetical protein
LLMLFAISLNLLMLVRKIFLAMLMLASPENFLVKYDLVKILGNVNQNMTTPPNVDGFATSLCSIFKLTSMRETCWSYVRTFVGHSQLYLFPGSGICFLQVSPGVGNLLEAKKSNIYRLFRHLAILFTRACVLRTMIAN